jgi:hypothetical protein
MRGKMLSEDSGFSRVYQLMAKPHNRVIKIFKKMENSDEHF